MIDATVNLILKQCINELKHAPESWGGSNAKDERAQDIRQKRSNILKKLWQKAIIQF